MSQLLAACIFLHETPAYEGALVYCGYGQGRTGMMITAYQIYSYYRFFNNLTPSQVVSLRSFFDVYINASTAEENVQEVALRNFFDYLFMHWGEHGKVRTIPVHSNVITHTPSVTTSSKITTSTIPIPPAMPPKFVMKKALVTHNNPVIQNPVNTLNTNKLNIFNFQKSLTVFLSSLDEFEKLNIQIIDQLILGCTNYLN
ncbi:MAG: hypothetical protein K2X69_10135, partial [Silvanigrellaceae bacterium]|nr:hypothetical protein [Silvanigrellaceae bacterium]